MNKTVYLLIISLFSFNFGYLTSSKNIFLDTNLPYEDEEDDGWILSKCGTCGTRFILQQNEEDQNAQKPSANIPTVIAVCTKCTEAVKRLRQERAKEMERVESEESDKQKEEVVNV